MLTIFLGWYGLSAAKTYLTLEPDTNLIIVDGDDSVGGVWSKKRIYPNLVAQVPHGLFNYPDHPMPKNGETDHHLVTGYMIQSYLENYAKEHDLLRRIRFSTWVEKAERCPRGWRLKIGDQFLETTKLIVASGLTSIPNVPSFKVEEDAVPVIHSRDLAASVPALGSDDVQGVVVVGSAKSAYDAVYLLCSMGKRVTWIIRPDGAGPMPIMPAEMFGINTISIGSTRLMNYLSPSLFNSKGLIASFFYRTALGRSLTNAHWRMITRLSYKAAGFGKGGNVEPLKPEIPDRR
jgi:dimethylaniline monooxygenase (N-oxide forming)